MCERLGSLPPPAFREGSHGLLARRSVAVGWRAAFVVREDECPHPWASHGRGVGLEDAANHFAVREHLEIIIAPLAGARRMRVCVGVRGDSSRGRISGLSSGNSIIGLSSGSSAISLSSRIGIAGKCSRIIGMSCSGNIDITIAWLIDSPKVEKTNACQQNE